MKKAIAVITLMTLVSASASYGEIYDFNCVSRNRISLEAYIDGEKVSISGDQVCWDNTESKFRMYVDTREMTTTIRQMDFAQGEDEISHTGTIKQGGFGGLDVPFTIYISQSYVNSSRIRDMYVVDWENLSFHMSEIEEDDEPLRFVGFAEVGDMQHYFDIRTPRSRFTINNVNGWFDDAAYPNELTVSFSCGAEFCICWQRHTRIVLFDTRVQGRRVTVYATALYCGLAQGSYRGKLISNHAGS